MSLQRCSGKGFPFNIGPCLIIGGFKTQCPDVFGKAKPKNPGFTRLWPPLSLVSEKVQELQEGPIRSLKKIMFFSWKYSCWRRPKNHPKKSTTTWLEAIGASKDAGKSGKKCPKSLIYPPKNDGWKITFYLGWPIFRQSVSFGEGSVWWTIFMTQKKQLRFFVEGAELITC